MTLELKVVEVPLAQPRRLPGENAYRLEFGGDYFGLLYLTSRTFTFAWQGVVDFDKLEEEVGRAVEVALKRTAAVDLRSQGWRDHMRVAIVRPKGGGSDELLDFALNKSGDFADYVNCLATPGSLMFVRYDFADGPRAEPFFSFAAESVARRQAALVLERSQLLSEALLRWVVEHHADAAGLHALDYAGSVRAVNQQVANP